MWYSITPEDSNLAAKFADEFANQTVDNTYNRMGYNDRERRRFNIYVGKIAEQIVFRYLREELQLQITEDLHEGGPDRFDFKINYQNRQVTGDVKSFHVYPIWKGDIRTPEIIETDSWALIPVDQYERQPKEVYVFAMILGHKKNRFIDLSSTCYIRWATHDDIKAWKFIPKGTPKFPYTGGTRNPNYGQKMSECKPMQDFIDYLNYLPPF